MVMKMVLMAGGLGTCLRGETEFRPKPTVPVGGKPILWHIMKTLAFYGYQEFIICTGCRVEKIDQYFHIFESMNSDFRVKIGSREEITRGLE
jgi:glucose-1-phosphate cytidylyltransferase